MKTAAAPIIFLRAWLLSAAARMAWAVAGNTMMVGGGGEGASRSRQIDTIDAGKRDAWHQLRNWASGPISPQVIFAALIPS